MPHANPAGSSSRSQGSIWILSRIMSFRIMYMKMMHKLKIDYIYLDHACVSVIRHIYSIIG
jgi:hypothetical protein